MTKPGKHGTLHRFTIEYTDECDPGFGVQTWSTWAYDAEHAIDKFYDNPDEGWTALRIALAQESSHRMQWQTV